MPEYLIKIKRLTPEEYHIFADSLDEALNLFKNDTFSKTNERVCADDEYELIGVIKNDE